MKIEYTGFRGTAELLGKQRIVRYGVAESAPVPPALQALLRANGVTDEVIANATTAAALTIDGLSPDEAQAVLKTLSSPAAPMALAVAKGIEQEQAASDVPERKTVAAKSKANGTSANGVTTARTSTAAPNKAQPPREEPEAAPQKADPPSDEPEARPADTARQEAAGAQEEARENGMTEDDGSPAGDLTNARKLRDVVSFLLDHGFTTPDAIVGECERLKVTDKVPVLSRIADVDTRVRRTLEVMGRG